MSNIITEIKCPVCGHFAKHDYYNEDVGTVEEYIYCTDCGYAYEFSYGSYLERVNGKEFTWRYTLYDDNAQRCRLFKKINREMFMARRKWRKGITKRRLHNAHRKNTYGKNLC